LTGFDRISRNIVCKFFFSRPLYRAGDMPLGRGRKNVFHGLFSGSSRSRTARQPATVQYSVFSALFTVPDFLRLLTAEHAVNAESRFGSAVHQIL